MKNKTKQRSHKTRKINVAKSRIFSPLGLKVQGLDTASHLLGNGEEMRNLCELRVQKGKIVESPGEFDFWQKALTRCSKYESKLVLPLYCDVNISAPVLSGEGNAILHQLFQIKFPNYPPMPTTNVSYILGSDFSNFSLIDVPGDGNCGISAVLIASGQMGENFFNLGRWAFISYAGAKRTNDEITGKGNDMHSIIHSRSIKISNRLSIDRVWIAGKDFAFVAVAMQRPIVLIQAATEGTLPYTMTRFTIEGNEEILTDQTPEQLLTNNPRTLFIYFNGINHFQALKRSEKKSCSILHLKNKIQ